MVGSIGIVGAGAIALLGARCSAITKVRDGGASEAACLLERR